MSVLASTEAFLETCEPLAGAVAGAPGNHSRFKRGLDLCFAVSGLLALSWLFALVALAIKLDSPGPVFFRQVRLGRGGKPFTIYKFRTMGADAEAVGQRQRHEKRGTGLLYKDAHDPRVTRVGRFLRRWSLDELPQVFNIVRGEMSLVGPRPLPMEDTRYYEEWQMGRLAVLPGLTGLWQVSGRSRLSSDEMVRLDLRYIREWTPTLEMGIILKTFKVLLTRDGAY